MCLIVVDFPDVTQQWPPCHPLCDDRQQLAAMQGRWGELEAQLTAAKQQASEAAALSAKAEDDLAEVSSAYNHLEEHAHQLEQQLASVQQAAELATLQAVERSSTVDEAAVNARIQAAMAAAQADAAAEADEQMSDLLVCLGQEEAKVQVLSDRLARLGVDVDSLVADIVAAGEMDTAAEGSGDDLR